MHDAGACRHVGVFLQHVAVRRRRGELLLGRRLACRPLLQLREQGVSLPFQLGKLGLQLGQAPLPLRLARRRPDVLGCRLAPRAVERADLEPPVLGDPDQAASGPSPMCRSTAATVSGATAPGVSPAASATGTNARPRWRSSGACGLVPTASTVSCSSGPSRRPSGVIQASSSPEASRAASMPARVAGDTWDAKSHSRQRGPPGRALRPRATACGERRRLVAAGRRLFACPAGLVEQLPGRRRAAAACRPCVRPGAGPRCRRPPGWPRPGGMAPRMSRTTAASFSSRSSGSNGPSSPASSAHWRKAAASRSDASWSAA